MSHEEFDAFHSAIGEACDYAPMKGEMAGALMDGDVGWFDIDWSWLELPEIDFSSIFDFFDIP